MKNISILGSTGSIGRNTLEIINMFPDQFAVKVLTAKNNIELLAEQVIKFRPEMAVVFDENKIDALKKKTSFPDNVEILCGEEGYRAAASFDSVDLVVIAVVSSAGLMPTLDAIESGKDIALANKETLVMAGEIVMRRAKEKGIKIYPVDSEHSAIFQCLAGNRRKDLNKIFLTASGGPFFNKPADEFYNISPRDALNHPTWQMGKKVSIDSATLMNKGLEVIEAKYLFKISEDMIKVLIHPQSVIHSMVAYNDGSIMAQLGIPDMKGAIAYALSYPKRLAIGQQLPDFVDIGALTFKQPDLKKFPCLALAFKACKTGETLPAVLNAANEVAVKSFLNQRISFVNIQEVIRKTMEKHIVVKGSTLADIIGADQWARRQALKEIEERGN